MSATASPVVTETVMVGNIHDANTVEALSENPPAPQLESVTGGSEAGDFVKVISPVQSAAATPNVTAPVAVVGPGRKEVEPPTIPANEEAPEVSRSVTVEDVEDEAVTMAPKAVADAPVPVITSQDTKKAVEVGNPPVPCEGCEGQEQTTTTTSARAGKERVGGRVNVDHQEDQGRIYVRRESSPCSGIRVPRKIEGPERTYIYFDGEMIEFPAEILQGPQNGIPALVVAMENGRKVLKPYGTGNPSAPIPTLVPVDQPRDAGSSRIPDFQVKVSLNFEGSDGEDSDSDGGFNVVQNTVRHDGGFNAVEHDNTFDVVEDDGGFNAVVQPDGVTFPRGPSGPGGRVNIAEPRSAKPTPRNVQFAPENATVPYPPPPGGNGNIGRPNIGSIGRPNIETGRNGNGSFGPQMPPPMPPAFSQVPPMNPHNLTNPPPPPPAAAQYPDNVPRLRNGYPMFGFGNDIPGPNGGLPDFTPIPRSPVLLCTIPHCASFAHPYCPPDVYRPAGGMHGPNGPGVNPGRAPFPNGNNPGLNCREEWAPKPLVNDSKEDRLFERSLGLLNRMESFNRDTIRDMTDVFMSQQRTFTTMAQQLVHQNKDTQLALREAHELIMETQRRQFRGDGPHEPTHSYTVQNLHQYNGSAPRTTAGPGGYDSDVEVRNNRNRQRRGRNQTFRYTPAEDW